MNESFLVLGREERKKKPEGEKDGRNGDDGDNGRNVNGRTANGDVVREKNGEMANGHLIRGKNVGTAKAPVINGNAGVKENDAPGVNGDAPRENGALSKVNGASSEGNDHRAHRKFSNGSDREDGKNNDCKYDDDGCDKSRRNIVTRKSVTSGRDNARDNDRDNDRDNARDNARENARDNARDNARNNARDNTRDKDKEEEDEYGFKKKGHDTISSNPKTENDIIQRPAPPPPSHSPPLDPVYLDGFLRKNFYLFYDGPYDDDEAGLFWKVIWSEKVPVIVLLSTLSVVTSGKGID